MDEATRRLRLVVAPQRGPIRRLKGASAAHIRCSGVADALTINGSARLGGKGNGPMTTVLDEVTSDAIDAKHVERRVEDWVLFPALGR